MLPRCVPVIHTLNPEGTKLTVRVPLEIDAMNEDSGICKRFRYETEFEIESESRFIDNLTISEEHLKSISEMAALAYNNMKKHLLKHIPSASLPDVAPPQSSGDFLRKFKLVGGISLN